ncbi:hypothetical protein NpPPO83_00002639 [Neofusicoccum parvum]|uniref:Uncharacterized protein n=1 Tax=Neofusicoccum parvum TaxID=310453 RepID=A0ACB5SFR7_9PEZI|nr:hypothetical protein NpPPO83_00002639 [Neofusicoccum parvum]
MASMSSSSISPESAPYRQAASQGQALDARFRWEKHVVPMRPSFAYIELHPVLTNGYIDEQKFLFFKPGTSVIVTSKPTLREHNRLVAEAAVPPVKTILESTRARGPIWINKYVNVNDVRDMLELPLEDDAHFYGNITWTGDRIRLMAFPSVHPRHDGSTRAVTVTTREHEVKQLGWGEVCYLKPGDDIFFGGPDDVNLWSIWRVGAVHFGKLVYCRPDSRFDKALTHVCFYCRNCERHIRWGIALLFFSLAAWLLALTF